MKKSSPNISPKKVNKETETENLSLKVQKNYRGKSHAHLHSSTQT